MLLDLHAEMYLPWNFIVGGGGEGPLYTLDLLALLITYFTLPKMYFR